MSQIIQILEKIALILTALTGLILAINKLIAKSSLLANNIIELKKYGIKRKIKEV